MKRYIVLIAALATAAVLFTGCGGADNVSHNSDGMIESSAQATERSTRVTVPTESTRSTMFGTEETGRNATEEVTEDAPSARGRTPRRF